MTANRPECPLIQDRLDRWLDGELPQGEAELIDAHLRGCEACDAEADALRQTTALVVDSVPHPDEFESARALLRQRIAAEAPPPRSRRLVRVAAGIAAAMLVGVVIAHTPAVSFESIGRVSRSLSTHVKAPHMSLTGIDGVVSGLFAGDSR